MFLSSKYRDVTSDVLYVTSDQHMEHLVRHLPEAAGSHRQ